MADQEMAKRHVELAKKLQVAAEQALALCQDRINNGVGMKPHEISRMVDVATRLERLSKGEVTDRVETIDLSGFTDEELEQYEQLMKKARRA